MPPIIKTILLKIKSFFKDMVDNIIIIYGEKGFEPFKKPLMIAVPSLLVLFAAVYTPITSRLSSAKSQLENMQVVAQHADSYEEAKLKLSGYQRKLPLVKDKDEWLNYVITSTARNSAISIDSLSAQREMEVGGYLVVSRDVTVTTNYHKLGKWIAEIENSPIFLRVSELTVRRDETNPNSVKVTFSLSTIFSKFGGGA